MSALDFLAIVAHAAALPVVNAPIEVETQVIGTADVPPQGFQISVYFATQPVPETPKLPSQTERLRAIAAVDALEPIATQPCAGDPTKLGFIGNEAVGGPDTEAVGAEEEPEPFQQVRRTFATLAIAKRAQQILRQAGGRFLG